MRDPEHIEHDIDAARHDLEQSLATLKDLVRDKIDVKAHVDEAIARAEAKVAEAYRDARAQVRAHPGIAALIGATLIAGVIFIAYRHYRA